VRDILLHRRSADETTLHDSAHESAAQAHP
jgi:hypothetical protein